MLVSSTDVRPHYVIRLFVHCRRRRFLSKATDRVMKDQILKRGDNIMPRDCHFIERRLKEALSRPHEIFPNKKKSYSGQKWTSAPACLSQPNTTSYFEVLFLCDVPRMM